MIPISADSMRVYQVVNNVTQVVEAEYAGQPQALSYIQAIEEGLKRLRQGVQPTEDSPIIGTTH
jgi:hypothetical protein